MRPLIYAPLLVLLTACGGSNPLKIIKDSSADSSARIRTSEEQPEEKYYVEAKHFDLKNFGVSVLSALGPGMKGFKGKYYPFDSLKGNILVVYDKKKHKRDTLDVTEINLLPGNTSLEYLKIKDVTRDVGFDKLAFILIWSGDSDKINSEIIGYAGDTLKSIYRDYDLIVDVKRKDQWTLTGHSWGEDEVTRHVDSTYVFTISLKTFEDTTSPPDTLVTSFDTEATDTIHAYRVFRSGAYKPYDIMPGTTLRVDTVFPKLQTVVISMGDSIVLRATVEQTQLKIKVSTAG